MRHIPALLRTLLVFFIKRENSTRHALKRCCRRGALHAPRVYHFAQNAYMRDTRAAPASLRLLSG